jgi:hypothetical protein
LANPVVPPASSRGIPDCEDRATAFCDPPIELAPME